MIRFCLRVLGFLVVAAMVTAVGGFSYLYFRKPATAPPSEAKVAITPARLARGKYLYNLADCDGCHSQRDFSRFNGPVVESGRGMGNVFPTGIGTAGCGSAAEHHTRQRNRYRQLDRRGEDSRHP